MDYLVGDNQEEGFKFIQAREIGEPQSKLLRSIVSAQPLYLRFGRSFGRGYNGFVCHQESWSHRRLIEVLAQPPRCREVANCTIRSAAVRNQHLDARLY
jgi:hypothetical protein